MFRVFLSGIYNQSIKVKLCTMYTGGGLSIDEGSFGSEWVTVCNLQGEEMDKLILRVGQLAHSTGVCL